jgi:hypothetical protein
MIQPVSFDRSGPNLENDVNDIKKADKLGGLADFLRSDQQSLALRTTAASDRKNFDSKPPVKADKNDFTITTSLGWKF